MTESMKQNVEKRINSRRVHRSIVFNNKNEKNKIFFIASDEYERKKNDLIVTLSTFSVFYSIPTGFITLFRLMFRTSNDSIEKHLTR